MSFPIPEHESERLARLRDTGLLDSAPEVAFDRLTDLAAHLFEVPTALVSLVDSDRQWFKARTGCDLTETSRDVAFCAHAVAARELLVVPDAASDPRFADNPLVIGPPGIRFYAGAPLITEDGHALGTLCLIDVVPRQIGERETYTLTALAATAMELIEARQALQRERALTTRLSMELGGFSRGAPVRA